MKVGDLVRRAYDKNKYRTGVILRVSYTHACAHVFWDSTPVGLGRTGAAWVKDLELLSEAR